MVRCLLESHSHIYARYVMSLIPDSRGPPLFQKSIDPSIPPFPIILVATPISSPSPITRIRLYSNSWSSISEKKTNPHRSTRHTPRDLRQPRHRGLLETYIDFLYRIHSLDRSRYIYIYIYPFARKVIADKPGRNSLADSVFHLLDISRSTFRDLAESSSYI